MDGVSQSPWWYLAGTVLLLSEGVRQLREAHTSHLAGWLYIVAALFLALAAWGASRRDRASAISTAPPNER